VEEYDREALCCKIWELTGVLVALWFRAIDNGTKKDGKNKGTPVKSLHIEIDCIHQTTKRSCIEYLYSSKATISPLDLKCDWCRTIDSSQTFKPKQKQLVCDCTKPGF